MNQESEEPDGLSLEQRVGPVRGNLSILVSSSEPVVTASGDFSIFVEIRNPFDVPVTVYSVQTHIPTELVD